MYSPKPDYATERGPLTPDCTPKRGPKFPDGKLERADYENG